MSAGLTSAQWALLARWLPGYRVVNDHSWGLVGTTVLEVVAGDGRYIVKAAGEADTHLARELRGHREFLSPFAIGVEVPRLLYASLDERVLVCGYLPGVLAQGSGGEDAPMTFERAGSFLARLHGQFAIQDPTYPARLVERVERWLAVPWEHEELKPAARRALTRLREAVPNALTATHGDFSPRNWLVDSDAFRVIDFGRADLRPAMTDLSRLASRWFPGRPELEEAFFRGYGADPRAEPAWSAIRLCEAIGTIGWAQRVSDHSFAAEGVRELAAVLAAS